MFFISLVAKRKLADKCLYRQSPGFKPGSSAGCTDWDISYFSILLGKYRNLNFIEGLAVTCHTISNLLFIRPLSFMGR